MRPKYWIVILVVSIVVLASAVLVHNAKKPTVTIQPPIKTYVALGDSVAAGIGLGNYTDSSACDRTDQAYPFALAKTLDYTLTSYACSGATIGSGILGSQDVNGLSTQSQLDQLFGQSRPDLVTLTIGANDVNWSEVLSSCYVGKCATPEQSLILSTKLQQLTVNLKTVLTKIQAHYGNPPKTVITGYYQVYPSTHSNCQELHQLTPADLQWLNEQYNNLNEAIRLSTTGFDFVRYVSPDFSGHQLCASDSWVQNFSAKAPFHPTQAGQNAYVKVIK